MVMAAAALPFGNDVDPLHMWTLEDLARLPDDGRRYEIVDGQLMMSPQPSLRHQAVVTELGSILRSAFGNAYLVYENVGVDIAPTYRSPDLTVFRASAYSATALSVSPADIALVVEVVSPGSRTNDRITKPAEYAAAGIGAYWRVETDELSLTAYVLTDGATSYTELGTWVAGQTAEIDDAPVTVRIPVAELAP